MIPKTFYMQGEMLVTQNITYLFHYTKAETLFKILANMTIKTSSLKCLNDLNEANVNTYNLCLTGFEMELQDFLHNHCSTISFCKNYTVNGFFEEGTNHPRMWAQYAQNSEGVCLVLEEESFIEQNKDILSKSTYSIEDVVYLLHPDLPKPYKGMKVSDYIMQNYKHIFFQKHLDWQQENERRLWGIDLPEYLKIKGAIKYICLGANFLKKKDLLCRLKDLVNDCTSSCYNYLSPQSFAFSNYGRHGYSTTSAAHFLL